MTTITGTNGSDPLNGTSSNDVISGGNGNDSINGGDGDDQLLGGNGNDQLDGGSGNDLLSGGNGVDWLVGGSGNDVLSGDNGDDFLDGGAGSDTLYGGNGKDTAIYSGPRGNYLFELQADGAIRVYDTTGADGDDLVYQVSYFRFSDGTVSAANLTFSVIPDIDTADYSWTTHGVTVDLASNSASGPDIGTEVLAVSIVNVIGGSGNDTLRGDAGDNQLFGGDGDDLLTGGFGGNDLFDGGNGLDRVSFSGAANAVDVELAAGIATIGSFTKTLQSIELVRGTNQNDSFDATGFSGASTNAGSNGTFNEFEGLGGDDTITGNGNTRISYFNAAAGVNVNLANGTAVGLAPGDVAGIGSDAFTGVNAVRGSEFDDELRGSTGNDTLLGGGGDDFLGGGAGSDTLNGGAGFDTAAYGLATGPITADLVAGTVIAGPDTDILIGVEAINGSNFNDTLRGDGGANTLNGNDGNDLLVGRGGNDMLNGGNGIDIAVYTGSRADYSFSAGPVMGTQLVTEIVSGVEDTTSSVELLQFNGSDTIADSYQLGYGNTPINLTGFGLVGGASLFGRGITDLLTMGTNANNRFIDLGGGTDTLTLGTANVSYSLNLANVENLVGSSGVETITMTSVVTNSMLVDMGVGFGDTLNLANGSNVVSVTNAENVNAFAGANTVTFVHNDGLGGQSFNLGSSVDGLDTLALAGSNSNYSLTTLGGDMTVIGASVSGNETVSMFNTVAGATFDLGAGNDALTLNSNSVIGPFVNVVYVSNVENVTAIGDKSDQIHILGNSDAPTTVTAGGGADLLWASADADHFRFLGTGDSPDVGGQRDVVTGFDAAEDRFVFDGILAAAPTWDLVEDFGGPGIDIVRVDLDGNHFGDVGWEMAIELHGLTGALSDTNFVFV